MKVPENRNYAVRSTARQPVANPGLRSVPTVRLPNIAGAIGQGAMAPLQAQLNIERERAAREQARLENKWKRREQALKGLISTTANAGKAIYDARDRRDAALLRDTETAYTQYCNSQQKQIRETAYTPGNEEDSNSGTGPVNAWQNHRDAYNDPRDRLPERLRNKWDARRKEIDSAYATRAAEAQIDREREWHQGVYQKSIAAQQSATAVAALTSVGEGATTSDWADKAAALAKDKVGVGFWGMGLMKPTVGEDGRPTFKWADGVSEEQKAASGYDGAMKIALKEQAVERLKIFAERINLNDTTQPLDEMRAELAHIAGVDEEDAENHIPANKSITTPDDIEYTAADRAVVRDLLQKADANREKIIDALDASAARDITATTSALTLGYDPETGGPIDRSEKLARYLMQARESAKQLADPARRIRALADIDETDAQLQYSWFMRNLEQFTDKGEPTTNIFLGENNGQFQAAMEAAEQIEHPVAREKAVSYLLTGRSEMAAQEEKDARERARQEAISLDAARKAVKADAMLKIMTGFAYTTDGQGNTAAHSLSPADKAGLYRSIAATLTPEEATRMQKIIRESASVSIAPADIDEIGQAAGIRNLSKYFTDAKGEFTVAPRDLEKSGPKSINGPHWRDRFKMPPSVMIDMVEAITQYKQAVALAGDGGASVKKIAEILANVLRDKTMFQRYCLDAQREANSIALAAYNMAFGVAFRPDDTDTSSSEPSANE